MNPLYRAALASLPHGAEFRFLDEVVALNPGVSGAATFTIRGDEPFLKGHFPGEPLFPGVLMVEAAAQLAGVVARSRNLSQTGRLRLTALRAVKILGTAQPGQTICFEAQLVGELGHLIQAQAEASVNGKTILQAALTLCEEEKVQ
jgi:3-hydroxyacyl-[acyl-carrier-protein] dehydratase